MRVGARVSKDDHKAINKFLSQNNYQSLGQFLTQIVHGQRKLSGSKSPNNFREFKCEHDHYVYTCDCGGYYCAHVSCWIEQRYLNGEALMGYLDIEVSQLKANFGVCYSWFIKKRGFEKYYSDVIKWSDILECRKTHKPEVDRRVITSLVKTLQKEKFDYLVCHYGTIDKGLDIRFLRTKAIKYGLQFPVQRQMYVLDTYPIAKAKLVMHSNRLDVLAEYFGCPIRKTEVHPDMWQMAGYADPTALKYITEHNKRDVQVLEYVHKKLEAYGFVTKRSI